MLNQFDLSNTVDELNRKMTSIQASVADLDTAYPSTVKEYEALITQSSTSTPTLIALKNTTGATVTASYGGAGIYRIKFSTSALTASKTTCYINGNIGAARQKAQITRSSATLAIIKTASGINIASAANALLTKEPFIIRVYA